MIALGEVYRGPEHRSSRIGEVLGRAGSIIQRLRPSDFDNGSRPWVNPVFVVAGTLGGPDFSGVRIGNFDRRKKGLVVEVALDQVAVDGEDVIGPIIKGLQMANAAAFHFFDDKNLEFALLDAEAIVRQVGAELIEAL